MDKISLFQLRDHFPGEEVDNFNHFLTHESKWHSRMPGGFLTNYPKRFVNAYGNGSQIDKEGKVYGKSFDESFWTARINQNNVTLHTKTEELPPELRNLVPTIRKLFKESLPKAKITDNTFTIAVCNYYTSPDMTISAHTDDDQWYPSECKYGAVFVSVTIYPEGPPELDRDYSRFQIKDKGKWHDVKLAHESIAIIPSNIEHRVMAHTKARSPFFKPRINITFRSCYPFIVNPILNAMCVANHSRYYRPPYAVSYNDCTNIEEVLEAYNTFNEANGYEKLKMNKFKKEDRNKPFAKGRYMSKTFPGPVRWSPNITYELIDVVVLRIEDFERRYKLKYGRDYIKK